GKRNMGTGVGVGDGVIVGSGVEAGAGSSGTAAGPQPVKQQGSSTISKAEIRIFFINNTFGVRLK
ncbi:MAG: hypothetical protein J6A79_11865, partial [Clostridia bacterium]|nr:hypothetical protein [Clostridia bacterium]